MLMQVAIYSPSGLNYKPWIDGDLLSMTPLDAFQTGRFHRVPVMTGYVADEWTRNLGLFINDIAAFDLGAQVNNRTRHPSDLINA